MRRIGLFRCWICGRLWVLHNDAQRALCERTPLPPMGRPAGADRHDVDERG